MLEIYVLLKCLQVIDYNMFGDFKGLNKLNFISWNLIVLSQLIRKLIPKSAFIKFNLFGEIFFDSD